MTHTYARIERERRFLICNLPAEIAAGECVHIQDLYLSGTRLRLRRWQAADGQLTYKLGQKFLPDPDQPENAEMTNLYLNQAEYDRIAVLAGAVLNKRRYSHAFGPHRWSIDVFEGPLDGLILAEIEVDEAQSTLNVPPFVTIEVTHDPFFTGGHLVTITPADLRQKLEVLCA